MPAAISGVFKARKQGGFRIDLKFELSRGCVNSFYLELKQLGLWQSVNLGNVKLAGAL